MVHQLFNIFTWLGSEWVLAILMALSVLTLGVILQRWFELEKLSRASRLFWSERGDAWFNTGQCKGWEADLATIQSSYPSLESDVLTIVSKSQSSSISDNEKLLQAFLDQKKLKLEKNLSILGTIGANAPFVGLLGTVLGIIRAFNDMSQQGLSSGIENITGGIAEALVATAIGLFVAVPAVVFFNILSKRINSMSRRALDLGILVLTQKGK